MNKKRTIFLNALKNHGVLNVVSRDRISEICSFEKIPFPQWIGEYRIERGFYDLSSLLTGETPVSKTSDVMEDSIVSHNNSLVPEKISGYVPFGNFSDFTKIIKSEMFYPIYITGLSGNGKTLMVEQACARLGRELIRTNIIAETDEDDLIGGFRLINGETVWQDGPVVDAMRRGAVLLLDEVDLGTPKMLCLQPVLEGKAIYIKKTKTVVTPKKGFNVVATANTKGVGSQMGNFIGTNVLNEAFLERFAITMEQEYPTPAIEVKILNNHFQNFHTNANEEDTDFMKKLVIWAGNNRKLYFDGAFSDIITTRRLVHILNAYIIFGSRQKALEFGLNRFEDITKKSLIDFYALVDEKLGQQKSVVLPNPVDVDMPF